MGHVGDGIGILYRVVQVIDDEGDAANDEQAERGREQRIEEWPWSDRVG